MIADLLIAWTFWIVIRWPMIRTSVYGPEDLRLAIRALRLESEIACQRELRAAGLAD